MPARHGERQCQRTHRLVTRGDIECERRYPYQQRVWCSASAATHSSHSNILGPGSPDWRLAMSMAVGEYVSVHVHSQADTEQAEFTRERVELRTTRASTRKLAPIYVARGLDPSLAKQVAMQLTGRACPRRIRHH